MQAAWGLHTCAGLSSVATSQPLLFVPTHQVPCGQVARCAGSAQRDAAIPPEMGEWAPSWGLCVPLAGSSTQRGPPQHSPRPGPAVPRGGKLQQQLVHQHFPVPKDKTSKESPLCPGDPCCSHLAMDPVPRAAVSRHCQSFRL